MHSHSNYNEIKYYI
uniref:Uncharacterized protein n=1 Tax=Anguilla anguilla TaxID=7936 RepID=A0A0E9Q1J7_ANGAN